MYKFMLVPSEVLKSIRMKNLFKIVKYKYYHVKYRLYAKQDLVFSSFVVAGLLGSVIAGVCIRNSTKHDNPIVIGENSTETFMQKRSKSD
ncbi:hypothetical protein Anas_06540 [Armadillidium nasatum]|uniref:Uncharacterized protein n=1 Tax=Armadillidium nasatum TaxID=96803 RepID=A0A5N5SPR0_9CRUS|nr:hypothetical protein Anas_06540 [Armadillidium nasatum]